MSVEGIQRSNFYIIRVKGNFDAKAVVAMRKSINQALGAGHSAVVFDLSDCVNIDSTAIGTLSNLAKKLGEKGTVGILKASKDIRDILGLASVDTLLRFYGSEEELEKAF
jgi:anti-anti-sigma factor